MEVPNKEEIIKIPHYGLKLQLDHVYPENWSQNRVPPFHQIWAMLGLILRYFIYYIKLILRGDRPIMDFLNPLRAKQIYGVPIGGMGSGTIGRGYRGEFCRFQIRPGLYEYQTVDANQFIVTIKDESEKTIFQSVLSAYKKELKSLSSWQCLIDGSKCNYTGLYPRSWTEYDLSDHGIKLICRQISPVIPNNYKDSSLPCAIFAWQVENVSNQNLTVTITFTFKNGIGVKKIDKKSTCSSKPFSYLNSEGVILYHQIEKTRAIYALGAGTKEDVSITKCVYFDPNSDGKPLWDQLYEHGRFEKAVDKRFDNRFGEMGVAIAAQTTVPRYGKKTMDLSLVWDIPNFTFVGKRREYSKFYTRVFGNNNTLKIVDYALKNFGMWEEEIYKWQSPILNDSKLPDWYKGSLFNQTYFVSDGGSIWVNIDEEEAKHMKKDDPRLQYGRYSYLEGHEYRMVNTYDVHFYASYALAVNWPKLQLSMQYDLRDSIFSENKETRCTLHDGTKSERKVINSVPHDLGDPWEDPYLLINAYNIFDVNEWRDLNSKFVLQVFRDYKIGVGDEKYLRDMYKALDTVMVKSEAFDTDGDGVIDNQGIADQTYDNWIMTGASAYCGGLWLAALYAMTVIGEKLGEDEDVNRYKNILEKGKKSFERKLWNGQYYNFDMSENCSKSIMADQLCGHWYMRSSGCNYEILPKENVSKALETIYNNNVLLFNGGNQGAVNGILNGKIDTISVQSEEMWIGVTSALASLMIYEGMSDKAWKTAGGMYKTMNEKLGLAFEYPEALYSEKFYRSIGYMRPLSIWSIQLAYEHINKAN